MRSRWTSPFRFAQITPEQIEMRAPLGFFDAVTGEIIIAPTGFRSDGTTRLNRPRWLRRLLDRIIGHPLTSAYLRASVLHDAEIAARTAPWWVVHTRYYRALRAPTDAPRVSRWRAALMTAVVFALGPRW